MIFNNLKDYTENAEFSIKVWKEKGKQNTKQEYRFSDKSEILTGICSMIERLIDTNIITLEDMKYASKMVIDKINKEEK